MKPPTTPKNHALTLSKILEKYPKCLAYPHSHLFLHQLFSAAQQLHSHVRQTNLKGKQGGLS